MKLKLWTIVLVASISALVPAAGSAGRPGDILSPGAPAAGVPEGWTSPVNISHTSAESRNPVAAVDDQGRLYVTWVDWSGSVGAGGERDMMFTTNRDGGWPAAPGVAGTVVYTAIDDVGFPTVAVNRSGSNVIVGYHDADFSAGLMAIWFREWAAGAWGPLSIFSNSPTAPASYITLGYSPVDGTLFGIFMVDVDVPFEFAMRYRDGATGMVAGPDLIDVLNGSSKYSYLTKIIAFDPSGTAHLVFTTHSEAWYSKNPNPKSFNGWTAAVNLSGATGLSDTDPRIAVDAEGEAYVVWQSAASGNKEILLRRTVNGEWRPAENISLTATDSDAPAIAVDPATKEITVAWQETGADGNGRVLLKSYRTPPGSLTGSWSEAESLSDGFVQAGEPYLVSGADGSLHLFFAAVTDGGRPEIMYVSKPGIGISVDSPAGGESWEALTDRTILWTTVGAVDDVRIDYSTDGGTSFATIVASTPNIGSYPWTVPNSPSALCLVRVSDASTGSPSGLSPAAFTILEPRVNPPVGLALDTRLRLAKGRPAGSPLHVATLPGFGALKDNTITFSPHPSNPSDLVAGYDVYRRKLGDGNGPLALIGSLDAAASSFTDSGLTAADRYAYALKTRFKDGRESVFSEVASEKTGR